MKIEATSYRQWPEAYRCTNGPLELLVVTSLGPRILSLRFNGEENVLYEDDTDFKVGAWRLYGGHRFTTAPESSASYLPDNAPCEVRVADDRLVIHAAPNAGLQRCLEIRTGLGQLCFTIRHLLRNTGSRPWTGAPWAITCVPPGGTVVVPRTSALPHFWGAPGEDYADAANAQWQAADDHFVVEPNGAKGKVGLASEQGWLARLWSDATFVIQGPPRIPEARYPDDGCNVEVFTCAGYVELETLGPLVTLRPGQELAHEQQWLIIPRAFDARAWRTIHALCASNRVYAHAAGVPA